LLNRYFDDLEQAFCWLDGLVFALFFSEKDFFPRVYYSLTTQQNKALFKVGKIMAVIQPLI